jgi:hypothetical protein
MKFLIFAFLFVALAFAAPLDKKDETKEKSVEAPLVAEKKEADPSVAKPVAEEKKDGEVKVGIFKSF